MPVALVTGVSGYIGSHVAKLLLEKGWSVRGTVRSLSDEQKVSHLRQDLPQIELVEADLLKEGSFDKAVKGCDYVFHTASPFFTETNDPYKDLVDPALKERAATVKRVVLTSSIAAVAGVREPGHIYTEEDWNLDSTAEKEPYRYSKRAAEEEAWKFTKEKNIDLGICRMGSHFSGNQSWIRCWASFVFSNGFHKCEDCEDGSAAESGTLPSCFGCVDVRDVAAGHVAAAETKEAKGRYLMATSEGVSHLELATMLRDSGKFESYPIPTKEKSAPPKRPKYNNSKVQKELGIHLTPIQKSVVDMAEALISFGIVKK